MKREEDAGSWWDAACVRWGAGVVVGGRIRVRKKGRCRKKLSKNEDKKGKQNTHKKEQLSLIVQL